MVMDKGDDEELFKTYQNLKITDGSQGYEAFQQPIPVSEPLAWSAARFKNDAWSPKILELYYHFQKTGGFRSSPNS
jgi:S-methylmethionine-dependent homocysteine/selenocysteine methylase